MSSFRIPDKPIADNVRTDDKVLIIQDGIVMQASVESVGNALGLEEAETVLADIDAVIGGTAQ